MYYNYIHLLLRITVAPPQPAGLYTAIVYG